MTKIKFLYSISWLTSELKSLLLTVYCELIFVLVLCPRYDSIMFLIFGLVPHILIRFSKQSSYFRNER